MLRARGIGVDERTATDGTHTVTLRGPARPVPVEETVPSDPSAAAFWLVAGSIHPDAEIRLAGVSTNPTRRAIIDILRRMGATIEETAIAGPGGPDGEPLADLVVRSSELRGIDVSPSEVAAAIDEVPVLALAAAVASGTTTIRGASELRHKESDRIAGIAAGLTALGADVRVEGDDIEIRGGRRLTGAATETLDDHRLAMTFAVAGLIAEGETVIDRPGSAAISYPGFFHDLEGMRA
jgi:3-phosphoshikimate 1-carboxyvinyltransferase